MEFIARCRSLTANTLSATGELYFWSFVFSLLIFALGAGFSIYEGIYRILYPVPIESPVVSYVVLALSFLFEGGSWLYSLRQFRRAKGTLGFLDAFRLSKDPPSFMTLFEDSAALVGILVAAVATFGHAATASAGPFCAMSRHRSNQAAILVRLLSGRRGSSGGDRV
jgi:divalent metal cation (Fe/Co/Zn/Cd) transporter